MQMKRGKLEQLMEVEHAKEQYEKEMIEKIIKLGKKRLNMKKRKLIEWLNLRTRRQQ